MTIEEIREAKDSLQDEITRLVRDFNGSFNGCAKVDEIRVSKMDVGTLYDRNATIDMVAVEIEVYL